MQVSSTSSGITMMTEDGASTPGSASEVKANVAADESLRDSSMSSETLAALCFESATHVPTTSTTPSAASPTPLKISVPPTFHGSAVPVSSASSTCTRESDTGAYYSDAEGGGAAGLLLSGFHPAATTSTTTGMPSPTAPHRFYRQVSEKLNAKIASRKTSRQGRAGQRTIVTNSSGGSNSSSGSSHYKESIRLVTGAVPILQGGKIMFVSSRKKPEWIIPKGGWESDEAMEESAIREVFEEAGVLGVLGPRLTEVQYETRKAKKRRLEQATSNHGERDYKRSNSAGTAATTEPHSPETESSPLKESSSGTAAAAETTTALLSPQDMERIREHAEAARDKLQQQQPDDKASVASSSHHHHQHSQVRMMLYPLYVQKVLDDWPESGRFRKAVDIDTAIDMLANRPELRAALQEVKERGLHLVQASELQES